MGWEEGIGGGIGRTEVIGIVGGKGGGSGGDVISDGVRWETLGDKGVEWGETSDDEKKGLELA